MILEFTEVTICNLFSYYRSPNRQPEPIRLGGIEPDARNIVVIQGRNGQGKTGFLNSLRLLFLDMERAKQEVAGRLLRRRGIGHLADRDFLQGMGSEWFGVFNRQAVRQHQQSFYIQASWREADGIATAKRAWTLAGESTLHFWEPNKPNIPLKDKAAQDALNERLPPEFVPFYFFDGDTLLELAESLASVQGKAISQLLGITRLEILNEVLGDLERSLPRKARLDSKREAVKNLAKDVERKRDEERGLRDQIADLKTAIASANTRLDKVRVEREQQGRDGWIGEDQLAQLEKDLEEFRGELQTRRRNCQTELLPALVLQTAPELIDASIKRLEAAESSGHAVRRTTWEELGARFRAVPDERPGPRPEFTTGQKEYLFRKIDAVLRDFEPAFVAEEQDGLDIAPGEIGRILGQLRGAVNSAQVTHLALNDMARLYATVAQKERALQDSTSISADRRNAFEALLEQERRLTTELAAHRKELDRLQRDLPQVSKVRSEKEAELEKAEMAVEEAEEIRRQLAVATRLSHFIQEYQDLVKRRLTAELSRKITEHWKDLMTSNTLIDRIDVDPRFTITLHTQEGSQWAPSAISAGMRQLLATAVLWALADHIGRRAPVVIDTPLGRLDRGHQQQLVTCYYPRAARQVILLPTDAEINETKLQKWYEGTEVVPVYRRLRLSSSSGQDTRVEELQKLPGGER